MSVGYLFQGEVFFITQLDPEPFQRGYWYFVDVGLQVKSLQYAAVEFEVLNLSGLWKRGLILDGVRFIRNTTATSHPWGKWTSRRCDLTREDRLPNIGGFFDE
jgi:hypothetical protein